MTSVLKSFEDGCYKTKNVGIKELKQTYKSFTKNFINQTKLQEKLNLS